jgi:hypothetical protein
MVNWIDNYLNSPDLGRVDHVTAYIEKLESIVIHGGYCGDNEFKSFIELNLETLETKTITTSPTILSGHDAVVVNGSMCLFGG